MSYEILNLQNEIIFGQQQWIQFSLAFFTFFKVFNVCCILPTSQIKWKVLIYIPSFLLHFESRAISSVGQSVPLTRERSSVRVRYRATTQSKKRSACRHFPIIYFSGFILTFVYFLCSFEHLILYVSTTSRLPIKMARAIL